MGLASFTVRVGRLLRLFHDVKDHTGSSFAAFTYVGRLLVRKLPHAVQQLRSMARCHTEARKILAFKAHSPAQRPLLAFKVTGGLGDYLVIARFVRDLSDHTGGFDFDIYVPRPEPARWVFGAVGGLREIHPEMLFDFTLKAYDLAARVNQFVIFSPESINWTRISARPKLARAVDKAIRYRPKIEPFIQHHPYMDGYLAQKAVYSNRGRADFLHYIVDVPYGGDTLHLPVAPDAAERRGLIPARYVTIHNGFDPHFFTSKGDATKCYPHFGAVLLLLKEKWPAIRFVQIGVGTSRPLPEADLNLVNQSSLQEAAGLIRDALLHVDNEGGLVHLARCLGVESCVVFGPTPANYFGYADNINISPTFCGGCWWNNETWMDQCPRGFQAARCMTEQDPRAVATAIDRRLSAKLLAQPSDPCRQGNAIEPERAVPVPAIAGAK